MKRDTDIDNVSTEGAEEILEKYGEIGVYDIASKWAVLAKGNEVATRNAMVTDLYGLLNAHTQRIAEKMVEERLREFMQYLYVSDHLKNLYMEIDDIIDNYIKSR